MTVAQSLLSHAAQLGIGTVSQRSTAHTPAQLAEGFDGFLSVETDPSSTDHSGSIGNHCKINTLHNVSRPDYRIPFQSNQLS